MQVWCSHWRKPLLRKRILLFSCLALSLFSPLNFSEVALLACRYVSWLLISPFLSPLSAQSGCKGSVNLFFALPPFEESVLSKVLSHYRERLNRVLILLRRTHTGPGRKVTKEPEEISCLAYHLFSRSQYFKFRAKFGLVSSTKRSPPFCAGVSHSFPVVKSGEKEEKRWRRSWWTILKMFDTLSTFL